MSVAAGKKNNFNLLFSHLCSDFIIFFIFLFYSIFSSSEQMNLTCDILCICMSNLEINNTISRSIFCSYLECCLQHKNDEVKMLALNDIERRLNESKTDNDSKSTFMIGLHQTNISIALLNCLECEETRVVTSVIRILTKLLPKDIDDKSVKNRLQQILSGKDLVRCRVYELGIKLSNESIESHDKIDFILEKIIVDLESEDILLKLTVLNFISDLALTEHGYVYLENKNIFTIILHQIERLNDNPLKSLLIPGYLKFFGNIAAKQPTKIIQGFPSMIDSMFDCILTGDVSSLPVAYDTLGT